MLFLSIVAAIKASTKKKSGELLLQIVENKKQRTSYNIIHNNNIAVSETTSLSSTPTTTLSPTITSSITTTPNTSIPAITANKDNINTNTAVVINKRSRKVIPAPTDGQVYFCSCGCKRSFDYGIKKCRGCQNVYVHTFGNHCTKWKCKECMDLDKE